MDYTPNLKIPKPGLDDAFYQVDIHKAYDIIDKAFSDTMKAYEAAKTVNSNLEVAVARGSFGALDLRLANFDSLIQQVNSNLQQTNSNLQQITTNGYINLYNYKNEITNDDITVALQHAINDIKDTGGKILIPKPPNGYWKISGQITINPKALTTTTIEGVGMVELRVVTDNIKVFELGDPSYVGTMDSNLGNCTTDLVNIKIKTEIANNHITAVNCDGLKTPYFNNFLMENVYNGIILKTCWGGAMLRNVCALHLLNCGVILVDSCNDVIFEKVGAFGCFGAVYFDCPQGKEMVNIIFRMCDFEGNTLGVNMEGAGDITSINFTNCYFEGNVQYDIRLANNGTRNGIIIEKNRICASGGIQLGTDNNTSTGYGMQGCAFNYNTIRDGKANSIDFGTSTPNMMVNCYYIGNSYYYCAEGTVCKPLPSSVKKL